MACHWTPKLIQAILNGRGEDGHLLPVYRKALFFLGEDRIREEISRARRTYKEGSNVRKDNSEPCTFCGCFLSQLKASEYASEIFMKKGKKGFSRINAFEV